MIGNKFVDSLLSKTWILLGITLVFFMSENMAGFDEFFQKPFYRDHSWLITPAFHAKYKWLLYTGIKVLIISVGVILLLYTLIHISDRTKRIWVKPSLFVIFCMCLIPFIVSLIKQLTGVYGPNNLIPYGGEHNHIGFVVHLIKYGYTAGGRCFPAGHASGGFALMSLYFLPIRVKWRTILFYTGLALGWFMGLYQMARGEHFISHTFTSMFLALTLISVIYKSLDQFFGFQYKI